MKEVAPLAQSLKKYQKKAEYSFTFGAFPTFELLQNRPEQVRAVYVHSRMDNEETMQKLETLCARTGIRLVISDKQVERLREKDSVLIIGVFEKYTSALQQNTNHVVLVNPSDMGNLGTILRTCLGFGIHDIAIIEPAADMVQVFSHFRLELSVQRATRTEARFADPRKVPLTTATRKALVRCGLL